jgi:hypothetical protein
MSHELHLDLHATSEVGSRAFHLRQHERLESVAALDRDWTLGTSTKIMLAIGLAGLLWTMILVTLFSI